MDNLEYNYHTHTSRCGHAFGKDEEYVLKGFPHPSGANGNRKKQYEDNKEKMIKHIKEIF